MATKTYTLFIDGQDAQDFGSKKTAVKYGDLSGKTYQVHSPSGAVVHAVQVTEAPAPAPAEERPLEAGEQLPGDTLCKECGETLDEHTWSPQSAASLCPKGGTEFNPADEEAEEDLIGDFQEEAQAPAEEPEPEAEEAPEESTTAEAEAELEDGMPVSGKPVDIEKMKKRIQMFLAKAEATPYEEERDTFNAAAEKLMIRLGISIAELESTGERKAEKVVEVKRTYPGNYSISYIPFVNSIAQGFGHLTVLQQRTPGLERHAYIIGHESDVAAFTQLLDSLELQVKSALRHWQKENIEVRRGLTDMQKFLQHRSFIEGFGYKVGQRLAERRTTEESTVSTGTALVLVGKDERIQEFLQAQYGELKQNNSKRSGSSIGWGAGSKAGENASLGEKGIKGSKGAIEK